MATWSIFSLPDLSDRHLVRDGDPRPGQAHLLLVSFYLPDWLFRDDPPPGFPSRWDPEREAAEIVDETFWAGYAGDQPPGYLGSGSP